MSLLFFQLHCWMQKKVSESLKYCSIQNLSSVVSNTCVEHQYKQAKWCITDKGNFRKLCENIKFMSIYRLPPLTTKWWYFSNGLSYFRSIPAQSIFLKWWRWVKFSLILCLNMLQFCCFCCCYFERNRKSGN